MAEKAPELTYDVDVVTHPELYVVQQQDVVDERAGHEPARRADVLVDIVIDVDGQERPLCINISRGTLGNDQPVVSYFERFADIRRDASGNISRDYDRVYLLAEQALGAARRHAALDVAG